MSMYPKIYLHIIMKKDIYIFRHGQTNHNLAQKWQGVSINDALNETGKQQAKELAEKVKNLGLEKIYSSPLIRAWQTGMYIMDNYASIRFEIMSGLREINFGEAEGLTFDEVRKKYGRKFEQQLLFPTWQNWDLHFPKGECKHDVFKRVDACLKKIVQNAENNVGVVCHAGVISALQCGYQLENVCYDNCSILHLQYDSESNNFTKID